MKNGTYKTDSGSIVEVSGKHSGIHTIDWDWFEENACYDCRPSVEPLDEVLTWGCDYCGGGSAKLSKVNDEN